MAVGDWGINVKPLHVHANPITSTPNTTDSILPLDTFLEVIIAASELYSIQIVRNHIHNTIIPEEHSESSPAPGDRDRNRFWRRG